MQPAPPPFARMAADPLRWRLLRELARSDRRVRELVTLAGQPQNLVSYHLGQLRTSGLVRSRRSSFDGRDTYYHLDLAQCAQALAEAGAALHPNAVRVMASRGIDLAARQPKHLSLFSAQRFDYVITLCDRVREVCPEFPGHPGYVHWSIANPAASGGNDDDTYPAFERMAVELEARIGFWLAGLGAPSAHALVQEV